MASLVDDGPQERSVGIEPSSLDRVSIGQKSALGSSVPHLGCGLQPALPHLSKHLQDVLVTEVEDVDDMENRCFSFPECRLSSKGQK